jgi:hypothetical protein
VFGRREVFQLAPGKRRSGQSAVPDEYLGRIVGVNGITYTTLDDRSRQGWKVVGTSAGSTVETAVESKDFLAFVRIEDGEMAFICHNDPLPDVGDVIGLAAPSFQRTLEANAAAETESSEGSPNGA